MKTINIISGPSCPKCCHKFIIHCLGDDFVVTKWRCGSCDHTWDRNGNEFESIVGKNTNEKAITADKDSRTAEGVYI